MSAPAADGADDESRHRQLTVLAGWRRFVDEEPAPPELLPDQEWRRLGDAGLLAYDEARLNHHSRLLVVATPVIRKVITEGRRLSYLNRNADSGRCGLILSGPARTGKTTAITQLGKTLEVIHRQRRPRSGNDIPVLYVTVPRLWGRHVFSDRVDTRLVPPVHGDASGARGAAWLWHLDDNSS